jgi:DNA repair exonuclease SbcCD ATPase subunit
MTKVTAKSTKAQILEAYKELDKEKSQLQSQLKQAEKQAKTAYKPLVGTEAKPPSTQPQTMMKNNTNHYNINQIIQSLEQLQVGFGSAVSQLSEHLIAEASSLEKLQEEINEQTQKLQELHSLEDIEENTLETLIKTYEESEKNFAEEFSQQQETLGQELDDLRKAWQKEQENKGRKIQERNQNYTKTKQRQEEEYQYNLQLQRQLEREEHEQQLNHLYKELEEARQWQDKQWQQREKSIADKEKEYAEAKQKVEEFEQKLEAEIKRGKEEGKGIGNYQARVKADLRSKEIEGEKQNYQLRIQALESTIANNEARIGKLSQQLDAALKQVQDLAVKAIEGASNRNSFEAIKEIALEQAKNQPKSK